MDLVDLAHAFQSLLKIIEKLNGKNASVTKNAEEAGGHFWNSFFGAANGAEIHCTFKNLMNKTRTDTGYSSGTLKRGAEIIHGRRCEHWCHQIQALLLNYGSIISGAVTAS